MTTIDDLYDIAVAFLDASIAALELTPAGAPDRAFVSHGQPALDCCDQLTVHNQILGEEPLFSGAGALAPAKRIHRGGVPQVRIAVQIARCVPLPRTNGTEIVPPSPADQQAAARMIDQDGWALWLGLSAALKEGGSLHEACGGAERLGGEKMIPQGGCGGWVFGYRYLLEGGRLGT